MEQFLKPFGIWGPLIFILIQIVQVVIPIIPDVYKRQDQDTQQKNKDIQSQIVGSQDGGITIKKERDGKQSCT